MLKTILIGLLSFASAHDTVVYTDCTTETQTTYDESDCFGGEWKFKQCDNNEVQMYSYWGADCTGPKIIAHFENDVCGPQGFKLTCKPQDDSSDESVLEEVEDFFKDEWLTIAIAGGMDLIIAFVLIVMMLCCMRKNRRRQEQPAQEPN